MKKINHLPENLKKVFIISLLTFFIFLTRGSHLLTSFNLPDATFVLLICWRHSPKRIQMAFLLSYIIHWD